MIKNDRRWIYLFDLDIAVDSEDRIYITMLEAEKRIEHLYKNKKSLRFSNNDALVARITDHKDIKQLMTYYNKTAAELALQLD